MRKGTGYVAVVAVVSVGIVATLARRSGKRYP